MSVATYSRSVLSLSLVEFSVSRLSVAEYYIDCIALIELYKAIEILSGKSFPLELLYLQHGSFYQSSFNGVDTITSVFLESIKTISGKPLYRIHRDKLLNFIKKDDIRWIVEYKPADLHEQFLKTVDEHQQERYQAFQTFLNQNDVYQYNDLPFSSFPSIVQTLNNEPHVSSIPSTAIAPVSYMTPFPLPAQVPVIAPTPMQDVLQNMHRSTVLPVFSSEPTPVREATQGDEMSRQSFATSSMYPPLQVATKNANIHSGYPSPATVLESPRIERGHINAALDEMMHTMPTPRGNSPRQTIAFPISQFAQAEKELEEDEKAGKTIVNLLKVLAIDPTLHSKNKFSIQKEKLAI